MNENEKLGAGILTIGIINLIVYGIVVIVSIISLLNFDAVKKAAAKLSSTPVTKEAFLITLGISVVVVISVILIFMKKALGVYSYFTIVVVNIIYSIISNGFNIQTIISGLVLPILFAIFIVTKKEIFGFGVQETKESM